MINEDETARHNVTINRLTERLNEKFGGIEHFKGFRIQLNSTTFHHQQQTIEEKNNKCEKFFFYLNILRLRRAF